MENSSELEERLDAQAAATRSMWAARERLIAFAARAAIKWRTQEVIAHEMATGERDSDGYVNVRDDDDPSLEPASSADAGG